MQISSIPVKMPTTFGQNASPSFIRTVPISSQIGIQNGAASFNDGFVPDNFTPTSGGGVPPFGQDFNGLLNAVTAWLRWTQAGAPIPWDSTFSTSIGGYPAGAIVASNIVQGKFWMSTADNNTTNPDDITSTNWTPPPGHMPSGTPVPSFAATANPTGYITANGQTIGNVSSGANVAAGNTLFLFVAIWNQFPNSACQLLNSSGTPISRGANAYADFAANNRLTTPSMRGSSLVGVDTMGGGATTLLNNVPAQSGNSTTPGSVLGENLHPLVTAELAAHNHGINDPTHAHSYVQFTTSSANISSGASAAANTTIANTGTNGTGISTQNNGSGTAHNTVQRSFTNFWNLAL